MSYFSKPDERGKFRAVKEYHDPERVPMILLLIGLIVGLLWFLCWAISP